MLKYVPILFRMTFYASYNNKPQTTFINMNALSFRTLLDIWCKMLILQLNLRESNQIEIAFVFCSQIFWFLPDFYSRWSLTHRQKTNIRSACTPFTASSKNIARQNYQRHYQTLSHAVFYFGNPCVFVNIDTRENIFNRCVLRCSRDSTRSLSHWPRRNEKSYELMWKTFKWRSIQALVRLTARREKNMRLCTRFFI